MNETLEGLQTSTISRIEWLQEKLTLLDEEQARERFKLKKEFADAVIKAQEYDIPVSDIASKLGKSRQAVYKTIKDVYGVRFPNMIRNKKDAKDTEVL